MPHPQHPNHGVHYDKSSRGQWYVVAGLAVASLVLGTIGFTRAAHLAGKQPDVRDAIYNSMRLFHMHFDPVEHPLPWELQWARFLAPLALGAGLVKGFIYAAHSHRHAFLHWYQSGHVVICGLGQKGLHLAREYRKKNRWVAVVEKDPQNEFLHLCAREHIHCIIGDAAEPAVLEEARAAEACEIIVLTPDDETNLRVAVQLSRLAPSPGRTPPNCYVHLENIQLRDSLQRHFEQNKGSGWPVHFFDVHASEARRVLAELPLDGAGIRHDVKTTVHVVILGFGRMGRSLALRAAQMGHFANGRKLRISVVDRNADTQRERFLFHYPALAVPTDKRDAICDLQFHPGLAESLGTRTRIKGWAAEPDTLLRIFICIDDNTRALEVVFRLQEALVDRPDCSLLVRVKQRESLADIFRETVPADGTSRQAAGPRIVPFGMVEDTCTEEAFKNPKDEPLAKAIHERFREKRRAGSSRTPENDPALRDWERLTDDLRASNFQQADHMANKLRAIGCEIAGTSDSRRAEERFTNEERDILAPLEHTRWNAERLLAGWRYGTPTDKTCRISENITDWNSLHESIQNYDYEAIDEMPIILSKASPPLKAVRRPPPANP
ncbi:MAG TPA: NAD(P)-binding protein [Verrucomicrobiae bacterium]